MCVPIRVCKFVRVRACVCVRLRIYASLWSRHCATAEHCHEPDAPVKDSLGSSGSVWLEAAMMLTLRPAAPSLSLPYPNKFTLLLSIIHAIAWQELDRA